MNEHNTKPTTQTHRVAETNQTHEALKLKIDDRLKRDLSSGISELSERLKVPNPPEMIILPLRASLIVFPAAEKKLNQDRTPIPSTFILDAGRRTKFRFESWLRSTYPQSEELAEIYLDERDNIGALQKFREWLKTDGISVEEIKRLQQIIPKPNRILIVDDVQFEGETSGVIIPEILKTAFGSEIVVQAQHILKNANWISSIFQETGNLSAAEKLFLSETLMGYKSDETGHLQELNGETDMELLGTTLADARGQSENPYFRLKQRFGADTLLYLRSNVIRKLTDCI